MKVFVTGATGYIGSKLALQLANKGFVVNALVRDIHSKNIPQHKNIKAFQGDLNNFESVIRIMSGCRYVFHSAAYTNLSSLALQPFYDCNVIGTEHIMKAAIKLGVEKVIYTSTLSVFGPSYGYVPISEDQPRLASFINDYELTKCMSEEIVLSHSKGNLSSVILNVSRVYGPGLSTYSNGVNRLVSSIIKSSFFLIPSRLGVTTNYVFIDDVVEAHLLAIEKGKNGQRYIIGGENLSYDELLKRIKSATKSRIRIFKLNYHLVSKSLQVWSGLRFLFGHKHAFNSKMLKSLFVDRIASSKEAVSRLGYKTTSFDEGLHQTIQFIKQSQP